MLGLGWGNDRRVECLIFTDEYLIGSPGDLSVLCQHLTEYSLLSSDLGFMIYRYFFSDQYLSNLFVSPILSERADQ